MGHRRERYCKWQRNLAEPSAAPRRRVQAASHQPGPRQPCYNILCFSFQIGHAILTLNALRSWETAKTVLRSVRELCILNN